MGLYTAKNFEKLKGFKADNLIICGMGGSGLPGEILNSFRDEYGVKVPITLWKDYDIPKHYTKKTLFIFVSFSGTTAETLSGVKAALRIKGSKIAILTGGGELKKLAETKKLPVVTFEQGSLLPRFALNLMFGGLIEIVYLTKIVSKRLNVPKPKKTVNADKIVHFIDGHIALMYTSNQLKSLAYFWKIWLNETAKHHAFTNQLPELNHNEIVGFEGQPTPFRVIFIEDSVESEHIKRRIALTEKLINKLGGRTLKIKLKGSTRFERFWGGVYLMQTAGIKLAVLSKRDPRETIAIDTLKAWMK